MLIDPLQIELWRRPFGANLIASLKYRRANSGRLTANAIWPRKLKALGLLGSLSSQPRSRISAWGRLPFLSWSGIFCSMCSDTVFTAIFNMHHLSVTAPQTAGCPPLYCNYRYTSSWLTMSSRAISFSETIRVKVWLTTRKYLPFKRSLQRFLI